MASKDVDLRDGCISQPLGDAGKSQLHTFVSPVGPHFHLAEAVVQTKGENWELEGAQLQSLKVRLKLGLSFGV